jgi:hypothetical protein
MLSITAKRKCPDLIFVRVAAVMPIVKHRLVGSLDLRRHVGGPGRLYGFEVHK